MTTTPKGLTAIFQPRSIAVVGASSNPNKTGGRPVHMLIKHGFAGHIWPVNPNATEIQGLPAFATLDSLTGVPDLILVAVPGAGAVAVLEKAAEMGVPAAIVLSAGFAESGPEGLALQSRVTEIAAQSGMRIVGPNCLGAIGVRERAIGTFSIALEQEMPRVGGISIVSQSGNIGSAALRLLGESGAGLARFVATGNEADVQAADAIEWLADDDETRVILCCLETCRDAGRLTAALDRARAAGKPVIALKIGVSEAGQQAAMSHTGGLAGSDRVYDAVFARHGAVRVHSLEELAQVGAAAEAKGTRRIGSQPSVAVIAASGGFGVMMADAAAANGLAVNPLGEAARRRINTALPLASATNPIDATAQMSADPDILGELLDAVMEDEANSTLCLMLALSMEIPRLRSVFTAALAEVTRRHPDRTLVACVSGPADAVQELSNLGVVCFPTIDAAMAGIAALGRMEAIAQETRARLPEITPAELDADACRNEATARATLARTGLPFAQDITATTADEAARAAESMGSAMAMKILSPDIQHKSDIGGVELGVIGAEAARAAFDRIIAAAAEHAPKAAIDGVLISPMTSGGTELILGTTTDPTFGPVVMVGLGGIFAEIFEDTSLRLAPVSRAEAAEMLRELRAFPLLDGARGRAPADLEVLEQAIVDLSIFAARHADEVAEIDINPLLARPKGQGAIALDALIIPTVTPRQESAE
ncbi:CoA-binding protein [Pseudooceanicola sediminis]|uniref:CoA-binding protein n=1 Tax=Pseudooceanicola sediminis TaxID=2211117 RepID=A0A399J0E8_9RHOB|nr:acetate--CoA ligase family protein [Pseudooceanicola sediminis]KAA2315093.1 acetate--CoA ligase family protein [Puniceibacterium sp. HSS470]RII38908.1 CoA-binding protein [Pseudooceanicola sediminis]|tara:strand:+ start:40359 stop:42491 length:2133 start_codon:yes stop_codon:yes gene_type:complete